MLKAKPIHLYLKPLPYPKLLLCPERLKPRLCPEQLPHTKTVPYSFLIGLVLGVYDGLIGPGTAGGDAAVDLPLIEHRDPLLRPWLEDRIKRGRRQLRGMEAARVPDTAAIAALSGKLETLETIRKETLEWHL